MLNVLVFSSLYSDTVTNIEAQKFTKRSWIPHYFSIRDFSFCELIRFFYVFRIVRSDDTLQCFIDRTVMLVGICSFFLPFSKFISRNEFLFFSEKIYKCFIERFFSKVDFFPISM